MATYAIGDIQGCYDPFMRLLDMVHFDPEQDQLWLVGDLVNRGGQSLQTLNAIHQLGKSAISVLGNHDISLIACYHDLKQPNAELKEILEAENADQLIQWLSKLPLLHIDNEYQIAMVHAGISPQWDLPTTKDCAVEVQNQLRQPNPKNWLEAVYGNQPSLWSETLNEHDRHRYIINTFTRMRYCQADGKLELHSKESPQTLRAENGKLYPWFKTPNRKPLGINVLFGHWSTLGYQRESHLGDQFISIDTGCVWGNQLTAIRLDSPNKDISTIQCNYGR